MTEVVQTRLSDEVVAEIDKAVKMFGGTRSDFIRRAIEMRLEWFEEMQRTSTLPLVKS